MKVHASMAGFPLYYVCLRDAAMRCGDQNKLSVHASCVIVKIMATFSGYRIRCDLGTFGMDCHGTTILAGDRIPASRCASPSSFMASILTAHTDSYTCRHLPFSKTLSYVLDFIPIPTPTFVCQATCAPPTTAVHTTSPF